MNKSNRKMCLITTDYQGVFFAEIDPDNDCQTHEKTGLGTIRNARNLREVVEWTFTFNPNDSRLAGLIRLAAYGPSNKCKVSPPISNAPYLPSVNGVFECSPEAVEALNKYKYEGEPC